MELIRDTRVGENIFTKYKRKEDDNLITQIKKRDGEIVNYDASKIIHAIQKASNEVEADIGTAIVSNILDDIETELSKKEEIATVECIQDLVEEALLANGYITTARAYIQYRERQKQEDVS